MISKKGSGEILFSEPFLINLRIILVQIRKFELILM